MKRRMTSQARQLAGSNRALFVQRQLIIARDHGRCVHCGLPGSEVHHRIPRGMGGSSRNPAVHALSRLVLLCAVCHRFAEANPSWSFEAGLRVHRGALAALVPVSMHPRGWVLLGDDGSVTDTGRPVDVPDPCEHDSWDGIDQSEGPSKVWQCCGCGIRRRGDEMIATWWST